MQRQLLNLVPRSRHTQWALLLPAWLAPLEVMCARRLVSQPFTSSFGPLIVARSANLQTICPLSRPLAPPFDAFAFDPSPRWHIQEAANEVPRCSPSSLSFLFATPMPTLKFANGPFDGPVVNSTGQVVYNLSEKEKFWSRGPTTIVHRANGSVVAEFAWEATFRGQKVTFNGVTVSSLFVSKQPKWWALWTI